MEHSTPPKYAEPARGDEDLSEVEPDTEEGTFVNLPQHPRQVSTSVMSALRSLRPVIRHMIDHTDEEL